MQDKLDQLFSVEILGFFEKLVSPIFGPKIPEPGPGSVIIGFLAKNYVGYANFRPKRRSGRPFRGENVFSSKIQHSHVEAMLPVDSM